ncbi:putative DNA repair protein XRCC3 [Paratrimastix pyriformis]|uniref:DNA repair protein XRCC3 n=1 Tax=Paratrimastix pyriformis TaxID=342808 RepID=A0ABQ8UUK0_9EUKA|nr:putative DNA repair protein XRCC3 [Paratrimastix pyriformis]
MIQALPPVIPPPRTALELLRSPDFSARLSTGDSILDGALGGGFDVHTITDLAGEAGAGKSQLCLQLACMVQLPRHLGGLGGHACLLSTEGSFSSKRLRQIAEALQRRYPEDLKGNLCDNVYVQTIKTAEELLLSLQTALPAILEEKPIRLVVIDSIAAVLRADFDRSQLVQRSDLMFQIASILKRLASKYHLVVVCVNQVTASFHEEAQRFTAQPIAESADDASPPPKPEATPTSMESVPASDGTFIRPALGLSWMNCVNSRIFLTRTNMRAPVMGPESTSPEASGASMPPPAESLTVIRTLRVLFSPRIAPQQTHFTITMGGLVGLQQI